MAFEKTLAVFTREILTHLPNEWKHTFDKCMSADDINGIAQRKSQPHWPQSLIYFLESCRKFSVDSLLWQNYSPTAIHLPNVLQKGMTPKKIHEVSRLTGLISSVCTEVGECSHLLDIGSGLGYIDTALHKMLGICVLGVECDQNRVDGALRRWEKLSDGECCNGIRFTRWNVVEEVGRVEAVVGELIDMRTNCGCGQNWRMQSRSNNFETRQILKEKNISEFEETISKDELPPISLVPDFLDDNTLMPSQIRGCNLSSDVCAESAILMGLHACGDLSTSLIKLFHSRQEFCSVVLLSCCYHKVTPFPASDKPPLTDHFLSYLPMSGLLQEVFTMSQFSLSVHGLRLAGEEPGSRWQEWTDSDHLTSLNAIAFRAILEAYCQREGLHLQKLKRRGAKRIHFQSFKSYVTSVMQTYNFLPIAENVNSHSRKQIEQCLQESDLSPDGQTDSPNGSGASCDNNREVNLLSCLIDFEDQFASLKLLRALQLALQPVIEALVLLDRVTYLEAEELGCYFVRLQRIFDAGVSPRGVAIVAMK